MIAFLHPWGDLAVGVILICITSANYLSAKRLKERAGRPLLKWRLKGEGRGRLGPAIASYVMMVMSVFLFPVIFHLDAQHRFLAEKAVTCPKPVPPMPDLRAVPFVLFVAGFGILILLQVEIGLFDHGILVKPFRFVPWRSVRKFEIARHPLVPGRDLLRLRYVNSLGAEKMIWMKLPSNESKWKDDILRILEERVVLSLNPIS